MAFHRHATPVDVANGIGRERRGRGQDVTSHSTANGKTALMPWPVGRCRYRDVMSATEVTWPRSAWAELDGPTHYVDFGGLDDGPLVVCVHGLGGSYTNWVALAPFLTDRARVVALDLAGHGRTLPDARRTDVRSNQLLLHRFLTEVVTGPVVLVGNSMGGLISLMQASTRPATV